MADWDFILAPATVAVDIVLDEVAIISNSVKMLSAKEFHSGLHDWVGNTAYDMSTERRETNHKLAMFIDQFTVEVNAKTFPEFIAGIADLSPSVVTDIALTWLRHVDNYPGDEIVSRDLSAYMDVARAFHNMKQSKGHDKEFDAAEWQEEWEMLQEPQQILEMAVEHLTFLWDNYLESEWQRVKPMMIEAVDAFNQVDYSEMTAYDAIEAVAGRNMRGKDFFEERLEKADRLVFMPNAHLGPYISWGGTKDDKTMVFFFGARPPKNAKVKSAALSRSELLVRLNALADETRLKILEMLTERDELCAQDFITGLDLSQSSASRHLRQLTASGYLNERRRDVAKCYSINPERIDDTIQALKIFLKKD
ncbi:MAG: metalloregulator ArsR/SmtB family transcription factor [Chloroflexota bacterium]